MSSAIFGSEFEESYRGWEAKQNSQGVIYYVNNELRITSWNHPYLKHIFDKLEDCYDFVKYAAYRTSLKLRALQIQTGLIWMNARAIQQVLTSSMLENCEDTISYNHAILVIEKILQQSDCAHQHEAEIPIAAEIILSFIKNLYDLDHCGKLSCKSLGTALTVLCSAKLKEKYKNIFTILKDKQNHITKKEFTKFIDDIIKITVLVKESQAFGNSVRAAVTSCFKFASRSNIDWINEESFYSWLIQEPQTLIWLPTLHRIQATENVVHDTRCCFCLQMPIRGFRYRCLYCFKYDLCQNCFLQGLTSLQHKQSHPMTEYCFPTSAKDNTKALLNILKNKLIRNERQPKPNYLPIDDSQESTEDCVWQTRDIQEGQLSDNSQSSDSGLSNCSNICPSLSLSDENLGCDNQGFEDNKQGADNKKSSCQSSEASSQIESNGDLLKKMSERIEHLEKENRLLQKKLNCFKTKFEVDSEFLEDNIEHTYMANDSVTLENSLANHPEISTSVHEEASELIAGRYPMQMCNDRNGSLEQSSSSTEITTNTRQPSIEGHNKQSQSETDTSNGLMYQTCDMSLDIDETKIISSNSNRCCLLNEKKSSTPLRVQPSSCEIVREIHPHLIYSSSSAKACRTKSKKKSKQNYNENDIPCNEKTSSTEDSTCIELSNIYAASFGVTPSFSHHRNLNSLQSTPAQLLVRKTAMEPVYMSTPMVHPPLLRTPASQEGKENIAPKLPVKLPPFSTASPLSAIPQWQKKRILLSCNSLLGSGENSGVSQTFDSTGQFSKLLEKADKIGEMINQGHSYLTTEDQDCYEKMLQEFEKECLLDLTSNKFKLDTDDADILQAVYTIEEAMKDLVQATNQPQHQCNSFS
ncbi:hypothetical protein Btru_040023 [Bulinus truncatus]|nr:hypothetical protein Btru_040023 [Bulinus truncatus]